LFCLTFFIEGIGGGFGHPGYPLATPLLKAGVTTDLVFAYRTLQFISIVQNDRLSRRCQISKHAV